MRGRKKNLMLGGIMLPAGGIDSGMLVVASSALYRIKPSKESFAYASVALNASSACSSQVGTGGYVLCECMF
jgi:hypothetical protein